MAVSGVLLLSASLSRPPTHSPWKRIPLKFRFQDQAKSEKTIPPVLWDFVGCHSKYPILKCKPFSKERGSRAFCSELQSVKNISLLNSTRHNTCSLVGSSGNLRNHEYGKLIDNSSVIIRINNPPVKGYEKFVGSRPADIMVINNQLYGDRCPTLRAGHSTLYVCAPSTGLLRTKQTIRVCKVHQMTPVYCLSNYIQIKIKNILKSYAYKYGVKRSVSGHNEDFIHSTSGLKALLFSMLICRRVDVFGFGVKGAKTFYYFSRAAYQPSHHEMFLEMRIIEDIANKKLDSFLLNLTDGVFGNVQLHQ
jgi:hypothetical protein